MAIFQRGGLKAYFDKNKLRPREVVVIQDNGGELWFCYSAGNAKQAATKEDVQTILSASPTAYTALQQLVVDLNNNPSELTNILSNISALQTDKLDKIGDSRTNTTTFTEATTDSDIATGETHETIFGKMLKSIKTLRTGKFDKSNIVQTDTVNDANKVSSSAVAYTHGVEIDTINNKLSKFGRFAIQDANVTLGATQTIIPMARVLENVDNYYTVNADGSITLPAGTYQITMNLHALIQSSDVIFFGVSSTGGFANLSLEPQSGAYQAYKEMSYTAKSSGATNLYVRGSSSVGTSYVLGYIAATDTILTIQKLA